MKTQPLNWFDARSLVISLVNIEKYEDALLLLLGIMTGFRTEDLLSVTVGHLKQEKLSIIEGKTDKKRDIPLMRFHEVFRNIFPEDYLTHKRNNQYLFTSKAGRSSGEKLTVNGVNVRLKKIFAEFDIETPKESSRILRKTYARRRFDLLVEELGDKYMALCIVGKDFNHESIYTTMTYIGLVDEALATTNDIFW